jgi:uncharacterized protein YndB with AHSA1/START domain
METTTDPATDLALRRSVTVNAPSERAWDVFTRQMRAWWPLETHSIRAGREERAPEELHLELFAGGRFYERTGAEEHRWGTVLECDPPRRIVLEWQVNPDRAATEIEVTFTPEGEATRVDLVHRGWERHGELAEEARSSYAGESGWNWVLGLYAGAAGEQRVE